MKLNTANESTSVIIGDMNEKKFGIIANDKMFNILSDKIYSDKIKAPIRELSTNAYDAHVEAGKENIPFEVHIPCTNELYFYIRDFGNGMDSKQIEELYTTYGWSDKNNSNKYTGCLGLGSKSPFAYTDSFEINSIKDGIKYIYKCYMEAGIPHVMKFDEFKTNESSGVMIKFDVKQDDVYNFKSKCFDVFRWFKIKPVIIGETSIEFKDLEEINGAYFSNDYNLHGILMGNIFYEDWKFLDDYIKKENIDIPKNFWDKINRIIIKSKIGDYDIAVSRESLSMNNNNGKNAYNFISKWINKQNDYFNKYANSLNGTLLEKYIKLKEKYCSYHPLYYDNLNKYLNDNFVLNNEIIVIKYSNFSKNKYSKIKLKANTNILSEFGCKTDNIYIVFSNQLSCKKQYISYAIDHEVKLVITNNKDDFNKLIDIGYKEIKISKDYNIIEIERDGYLYDGNTDVHNRIICEKHFNTINEEIKKNGYIFYIPIFDKKPSGNIPHGINFNYVDIIKSAFKKKIYFTYTNDTKIIKDKKNCINVIDLINNIYKHKDKFNYLYKYVDFEFNPALRQILSSIQFNKELMEDKCKIAYDKYIESINNKNSECKLNAEERLFFSLFSKSMASEYKTIIYSYIMNEFPLIPIDNWCTFEEKKLNHIKEYVELIENKRLKEKEK